MAVKNNIDVFYFSCLIPLNVLFVEDGKMGECLQVCGQHPPAKLCLQGPAAEIHVFLAMTFMLVHLSSLN